MIKLRGCPKCHGDLYAGKDIYGEYLSCIQCGRYFDVAVPTRQAAEAVKAASAVGPPEEAPLELAA